MATLTLLYNNYADTGTFSGGSWQPALPLTNMQTSDVQRVARSINAMSGSTTFDIDLGLPRTVDGIAFGPINLSPGATWQARFYSDSAHTALVHNTGIQQSVGDVINWADSGEWFEWEDPRFWLGIIGDIDQLPFYAYYVAPNQFLAQYVRVNISDSDNASGYVQIGRVLVTQAYRPSFNYDEDNEITVEPLVDVVESLGGRRSYWERGVRRRARYSFPNLTEDELFGDVLSVALRASTSRQVFVVPDPADEQTGTRRSFLATMARSPSIRQLLIDRGTTAFEFEEVL